MLIVYRLLLSILLGTAAAAAVYYGAPPVGLAAIIAACVLTGLLSPLLDNLPVPTGNRETGAVKWFNANKGFGFITRSEGDDVFVHFRALRDREQRSLREGQRVAFSVVETEKGPQAEDVSIL